MADENNALPADELAFEQRVTMYLEVGLSQADLGQLGAELAASPRKREIFVQFCGVATGLHREGIAIRNVGRLSRPRPGSSYSLAESDAVLGESPFDWESSPTSTSADARSTEEPRLLSDAMILPAIRDSAWDEPNEPVAAPPMSLASTTASSASGHRGSHRSRRWWIGRVAAAALVVIAIGLTWMLLPDRQPCVVTAVAAGKGVTGTPILARTILHRGEPVQLQEGGIELTFGSGAIVVVRGPARFSVLDRNTLVLESGSVSAHVPVQARGFRVTAPGLSVVDLGTNFGVRVGENGSTAEVHVFDGTVEATALAIDQQPLGTPTRLTAGHALASASTALVNIAYAATGFDRSIDDVRIPVRTFGTGEGVADGSPDPHWQVTAASCHPKWRIRPAVVLTGPLGQSAPNAPDARWVSTTSVKAALSLVGVYTFHTTVDLTGYDPSTVSVRARGAADDQVADVVINGVKNGTSTPRTNPLESILTAHELKVTGPWQPGVNQVDVLVANLPVVKGSTTEANPMSFQFGWTMTAAPLVQR